MKKHLEGVRVIDLTAYLSGPFVSLNLAAMGAEVIKIERPKIGDPCRWNPPFAGPDGVGYRSQSDIDVSLLYLKRNRGKKSIFLNMRNEKGKKILERLVEKGDVVVENCAPGSMERLGFDYERLKEITRGLSTVLLQAMGRMGRIRTAQPLTLRSRGPAASWESPVFPTGLLHVVGPGWET